MFLVTFKKLNDESNEFLFDKPMTFKEANGMLVDAAKKYNTIGKTIKIGYKIIEYETSEVLFNSRVNVNQDIDTLFLLIKKNSNAPKAIVDYAMGVEKGDIDEKDIDPFISNIEQKTNLDRLKSEKKAILDNLKQQEKLSRDREIEYKKTLQKLQIEKEFIEKSIALKEKEESEKEAERLQKISEIEERKKQAEEIANRKRLEDKEKKEEHEKKLKEIEEESKNAEYQLARIQEENEKKEIERQTQLQEHLEKRNEAMRKAQLLNAENEKKDAELQSKLVDQTSNQNFPEDNEKIKVKSISQPENIKTRIMSMMKSIDIEKIIAFLKKVIVVLKKGMLFTLAKIRSGVAAYKKNKEKERELNTQLEKAKIDFINEIRKEKRFQERKEKKEAAAFERKEQLYLKEINKRKKSSRGLNSKGVVFLLMISIFLIGGAYLYDVYTTNQDALPDVVNQIIGVLKDGKELFFN